MPIKAPSASRTETSSSTTNTIGVAWTLTGFLIVSGVIGYLGAPRNEGKSLEEIQVERT
jgi:inositol transporter-like SP family MFS transporter